MLPPLPVLSSNPCRRRLGLLVLAVTLGACGRANIEPHDDRAPYQRVGNQILAPEGSPLRERLKIEPAEQREVRRHLSVPATVEAEPAHLAKISPPAAGRVVRLYVKFGQEVKNGEPLFEIDSPDLAGAQADQLRAQSALAQAERNLARQQDLIDHGIGAKRELEQAQTDRDVARGELERARRRLQVLGGGSKQTGATLTVCSPIAGRVVELSVAPGEFRNDPAVPLMIVADLSRVWVTASVQEKDIRFVHQGDDATATLVAYPGETFSGHVLLVSDLLDPDTRTLKARVAFDNPDQRLKPGMFATVTFTGPASPAIVVPTPALVLVGDKSFAFVEVGPWTFERRAVTPGEQRSDRIVVTAGLDAGARVVSAGAVLLQ